MPSRVALIGSAAVFSAIEGNVIRSYCLETELPSTGVAGTTTKLESKSTASANSDGNQKDKYKSNCLLAPYDIFSGVEVFRSYCGLVSAPLRIIMDLLRVMMDGL